ncbi:hypothetical protein ABTZ78_17280 [Streptomyces bauhiniae]|uniref:hypothetical protein n=1 Tax=Streptomyces bauhiniae TaxID=2340725 RepID=UPI00332D2F86
MTTAAILNTAAEVRVASAIGTLLAAGDAALLSERRAIRAAVALLWVAVLFSSLGSIT